MSSPDFYALMSGKSNEPDQKDQGSIPDFYSAIERAPKQKSGLEKTARLPAQYAIGRADMLFPAYSAAAGLTHAIASGGLEELGEEAKQEYQRLSEKKKKGELSHIEEATYDRIKDMASRKLRAPPDITPSGLIEKGVGLTGYDIKPEGIGEHGARIAGNLLSPKNIANIGKSGAALLTKEGRVASQWKSLAKAAKGNPEKEGWLNFAKSKDLTPQEATLLIQSKGEIDVLGKMAKKTKNFKQTVQGLKDKLGKSYEVLKEIGRKGGMLGEKVTENLSNDLSKVLENMGKTFIEGPDTKAARKAIEESLFAIENQGGTVEHLINSRQNLRQAVDWKKVDSKGAMLKQAEDAFTKAIEHANPKLASELKFTDKAWSKYKNFEKILDKKLAKVTYKGVEVPGFIKFLAYGGAAIAHPGPVIGGYIGKELGQRLITKMLTSPKLQGLHKKLINAVQEGATNKQKEIMIAFKKILKSEHPELHAEISDLSF
ncbi:MAG TPA: hypothetical protein VMR37_05765 [Rhabdochlamydiaceae bacterium]|nr:hypothetical protein [Rhabdochlamydiaceae bacterium]